jgi:hypothetical protein
MQNVSQTYLSQYANSPILTALIESLNDAIDPSVDIDAFYNNVWNIDTATGYGLDVWGRIVGISRYLQVSQTGEYFGFKTGTTPNPYLPFNFGVFRSARPVTTTYALPDSAYRVLILIKAFANIAACNIPTLNQLVRMLFVGLGNTLYVDSSYIDPTYFAVPDRSRAYVVDNGDMTMTYVFDFPLSAVEVAIVNTPGLLPHPTGVAVSVVHQ